MIFDIILLFIIAFLTLLILHRRLGLVSTSHDAPPLTQTSGCINTEAVKLGFDRSRPWYDQSDTRISAKSELYWQWRAAERLAGESRVVDVSHTQRRLCCAYDNVHTILSHYNGYVQCLFLFVALEEKNEAWVVLLDGDDAGECRLAKRSRKFMQQPC